MTAETVSEAPLSMLHADLGPDPRQRYYFGVDSSLTLGVARSAPRPVLLGAVPSR